VAEDEGIRKSEPKNDRRRRLRFAAFLSVALVGVATVLYLKFGQTTKIDYLVKAKPKVGGMLQQPGQLGQLGQPGQPGQPGQSTQQAPKGQQLAEETAGSNSQVEAAIAQMKEARRTGKESTTETEGNAPDVSAAAASTPRLSLPSDYISPRSDRSEGG